MSNVNRILLLVFAWCVLGTAADRWLHDAMAITPVRRIAWPQGPTPTPSPTPTPRPTSTIFAANSSTACSTTERWFSQGVACSATYANVDLQWNAGNATVTGISCGQTQDSACTATFRFYTNSGAGTALQCSLPASNSNTTPCTSSGTVSVTNSNMVAMSVTDGAGNCSAIGPTCTIFYTVP